MSLQLKTFAVLFAALTLSVSAAAQTMIASVQTDKKSNTVKVAAKPAPKAQAAAAAAVKKRKPPLPKKSKRLKFSAPRKKLSAPRKKRNVL